MLRRFFCKLLLVAIVIFSLLTLSSAVMAQGRSEEAFQRVKEVQERHTLKLMAKKGVVGTAIGLNDKGKHVVLIFLEKPGVAGIPKELEGVPVKQKVTGKIYALGKPPKADKPPKPPTGLTAVPVSKNQINLYWNDNREKDVVGYNVYRDDDPNPVFTSSSSYSDEELAPSTTYYYFVTAVDAHNESDPSNEASATTEDEPGDTTPPVAPTGLTATPMSSSEIYLDWIASTSDDVDDYNVHRSLTPGGPYTQVASGITSVEYTDSGLSPDTTYYYVVTAEDTSNNESSLSNETLATTEDEPVDTTPPAAPSGLNATAVSSSRIDLSWTPNTEDDLDYYNLYRSDVGLIGSPVGNSYSDTGLSAETTYTYEVTAVDTSDNESGYSGEASATTDAEPEIPIDPSDRFERPVPIGVSTGHPAITAGTIGCRLRDTSGNIFALSNNHVYADENLASIGDNVLQPGTFDDGVNPDDAIGTLTAFEPIRFYPPFVLNTIDAAIAECSEATLGNSTPEGGYGIPNSTPTGAYIGQAVQKYGRTTGLTKGTVVAVNGAFFVGYGTGSAIFVDQIVVEPGGFSDGGDSGSLVVTDDLDCNPVGLLFAGSSTQTIVNPIDAVLGAFSGVSIDGK